MHDPEKSDEMTDADPELTKVAEEARDDIAEKPGTTKANHEHADDLADEWGEESFPGSDPPAHY